MISYRSSLERIGIPRTHRVAYRDFYCRPKSLSQAMKAMQPAGEFSQIFDIPVDDDWTDAVNGCATDGAHWFFTSNQESEETKPQSSDKSLHVFKIGPGLLGEQCGYFNFDEDMPVWALAEIGYVGHIGQLEAFEDKIYVSHSNDLGTHVIILQNDAGRISHHNQINIAGAPARNNRTDHQFQCIVPWDRTFLTCVGGGVIDELFVHDLNDGKWTGRTIRLQTPISADYWVQGAAFSDYGHLFISTSYADLENKSDIQPVHIVSPLNGRELGAIPVCAEDMSILGVEINNKELEGCCYRPITLPDGRTVEFHVVLLDNQQPAKDNIFFKSYQRNQPPV